MQDALENDFEGMIFTKEKSYGKIEKREYFQTNDIDWLSNYQFTANSTIVYYLIKTKTLSNVLFFLFLIFS